MGPDGHLPQGLGLIEELPVRENVELPARLGPAPRRVRPGRGGSSRPRALRVSRHRLPGEVSLGEQQRSALARALVLRPRS